MNGYPLNYYLVAFSYFFLLTKSGQYETSNVIISDISPTDEGRVVLKITGEMMDEVSEVGDYTFQIRLYDEGKTSRVTMPEVVGGITIKEPLDAN